MAGGETIASAIVIEDLSTTEQFRDAVELQRAIWGFDDVELLPLRLFVVATRVGGQVFGAFHQNRMVAFCISIPGLKPAGRVYLHSHMLGVAPGHRNQGIGRMLKLRQREDALARGIDLMEWTFDPLEFKNAHFNIAGLGAVVRRYVRNQYGTTSSALHAGLPTDRCIAEWWMARERVKKAVAREGRSPAEISERISLPADIAKIRAEDPKRARALQAAATEQFLDAFDRGLAVVGFSLSHETGEYLLGKWE